VQQEYGRAPLSRAREASVASHRVAAAIPFIAIGSTVLSAAVPHHCPDLLMVGYAADADRYTCMER
jgi:hypothetical protein